MSSRSLRSQFQQDHRIYLDPRLPPAVLSLAAELGITSTSLQDAELCIVEEPFALVQNNPTATFLTSGWLRACVEEDMVLSAEGFEAVWENEQMDTEQDDEMAPILELQEQPSTQLPASRRKVTMNVKNARRDAEDPEDAKAPRWTRQEKQDLVVALASETRSLTGACKTFLRHPERRGRGQTVKSVLVHIRTSNDFYKTELAKLDRTLPRAREGGLYWSKKERDDLVRAVAASSSLEAAFELFHQSNPSRTVPAIAAQWKNGVRRGQYETLVETLLESPNFDLSSIVYTKLSTAQTNPQASINSIVPISPSSSHSSLSPSSSPSASTASAFPPSAPPSQFSPRRLAPKQIGWKGETSNQRSKEDARPFSFQLKTKAKPKPQSKPKAKAKAKRRAQPVDKKVVEMPLKVGRVTRSGSSYVASGMAEEDAEVELALKRSLADSVGLSEDVGQAQEHAEDESAGDLENERMEENMEKPADKMMGMLEAKVSEEVGTEMVEEDELIGAVEEAVMDSFTKIDEPDVRLKDREDEEVLSFPHTTGAISHHLASPLAITFPSLHVSPSSTNLSAHRSPSRQRVHPYHRHPLLASIPLRTDRTTYRAPFHPDSSPEEPSVRSPRRAVNSTSAPAYSTGRSLTYDSSGELTPWSRVPYLRLPPPFHPTSYDEQYRAGLDLLASFDLEIDLANFGPYPQGTTHRPSNASFRQTHHSSTPLPPLPPPINATLCFFCTIPLLPLPNHLPHHILTAAHEPSYNDSSTLSLVKRYQMVCGPCEARFEAKKLEMQRRGLREEERVVVATLELKAAVARAARERGEMERLAKLNDSRSAEEEVLVG